MIEIIFDGDLVRDDRVSMRTLGNTYMYFQKALERAYIDITRDGIGKNERLKKEDYRLTEFYLERTKKGSFKAFFQESTESLKQIIDRVSQACLDPYTLASSDALIENNKWLERATEMQENLNDMSIARSSTYQESLENPNLNLTDTYANLSIRNHVYTAINPVRKSTENSSIIFKLNGHSSSEYYFDKRISDRFGQISRQKDLGLLIRYKCTLLSLTSTSISFKGRVKHQSNGKESNLIFLNANDYNQAIPYLVKNENGDHGRLFEFAGYVISEMGELNIETGDIVFASLV